MRHETPAAHLSFKIILLLLCLTALTVIAQAQINNRHTARELVASVAVKTSAPKPPVKRLMPLRLNPTADGSRIVITSDSQLNDYSAARNGARFNVVMPRTSAASMSLGEISGRGFTSASVEQRGDDAVISFTLEEGARARVVQSFNRLEIIFVAAAALQQSALQETKTSNAQTTTPAAATAPQVSPTPVPTPAEKPTQSNSNVGTPDPNSAIVTTDTSGKTPPPANAPTNLDAAAVGLADKAQPLRIARFDKAPVIDGKLDEDVWKQATMMKDFHQYRPSDIGPASARTEAWMGYDARFIYFAFHCYDDPSKVRATVAKRDHVLDDDVMGVYLDTFNDQRRGYVMFFNPLGVQQDGLFTEGQGEDFSVDIVMDSKGTMTADGYTIEVAIPFKSLRYEAGKDKLWGLQVMRQIKHVNGELDTWTHVSRNDSSWLGQAGKFTGLDGVSTERTLEIIPSLTLSETGKRKRTLSDAALSNNRSLTDPGRFVNEPIKFDPGLTAKFGITPTVTLDLAINPDFAQVEADQTVVTANQRFPIFFEEKRPFFLEGIDYFQTPLQPVHTRTIVDPDFAVKLTGKRGRNTFGLMLASDNAPGNFSPEERESDAEFSHLRPFSEFFDKNSSIGVLRVKRDFGKENSLGIIATHSSFLERHNDLAGIDGRIRFDKQSVMSFQVLATKSKRFFYSPDKDQDEYRNGDGFAYSLRFDKDGRHFSWNFDGQGRTRDYRADVGFTRRVNTNREGLFMAYNSEPKPKATLISWRVFNLIDTNFDWQGRMQYWGNESQLQLKFKRETYTGIGYSYNYERIFEEEFGPKRTATRRGQFYGDDSERTTHRPNIYVFGGFAPSKKYSGNYFAIYNWGTLDFDFGAGNKFPRVSPAALLDPDAAQDPGRGRALDVQLDFTYQPTNALRTTLEYTKSRLRRYDTGLLAFDENIFAWRTTYQFTRFTFARARIDFDSLSANVRGQFLLGYTPNPGTAFYVGYNDDMNRNGFSPFTSQLEPGFRRNGRTFFIKMSYLFRKSF
jgi:hypothetical protein